MTLQGCSLHERYPSNQSSRVLVSALEDMLESYQEEDCRKLLFSALRAIQGNLKQNLTRNNHSCFVLSRTRAKMPLSCINVLDMWMAPSALFPHFSYVCILYYNYLQTGFIVTDSNSEYLNWPDRCISLYRDEILFVSIQRGGRGVGGRQRRNVGKVWGDEEKATWKGQREMESAPRTSLLWLMNLTCV